MNDIEYLDIQEKLGLISGIVYRLDLDGFLARIERAETIGCVVDPTLYQLGSAKLVDIRRLAQACKKLQDEIKRQLSEAES